MKRVLISNFDTIVGLGVVSILTENGCEVQTASTEMLEGAIADFSPDALVADLDNSAASAAALQLVRERDGVSLVLCSSDRPTMRVHRPGRPASSYESKLSTDLLIRAVIGT